MFYSKHYRFLYSKIRILHITKVLYALQEIHKVFQIAEYLADGLAFSK